jgi:epoxyqueuosine reductase
VLKGRLHDVAVAAGCVGFGVARVDPFADVRAVMEGRKASGLAADLAFTYRDPPVATDIRRSFPWAARLIALAWAYVPGAGAGVTVPGRTRIGRFADGDQYADLRAAADAVAEVLHAEGHRGEVLIDDSRLVDRAVAVRAGVAWWGKSTMVLVPGPGPWVLLGSVVTDALLGEDGPMDRTCGTCTACIPACPTGAILPDGSLDARRCLAHWLQHAGIVPFELRRAIGDRLYGCDDCLTSCPPGRRAYGRAHPQPGPAIVDVLGSTDADLLARYGHFYLPGRRPRIVKRNALIAAGNDGSPDLVPFVAAYLGHADWMLRAHAAWAAGEFAAGGLDAALGLALSEERDGRVRREIRLAMSR